MPGEDLAATGKAALDSGRWAEARAAFEAALSEGETAEVLDGLGEALWWLGEPLAAVEHRERAYVAFRRAGEGARAAHTALSVCTTYLANFGNGAAAAGWLARAESAVSGAEAEALQGWFWLMAAYLCPDGDEACEQLRRAHAVARDIGDVDLELTALSDLGGRLVYGGRVAEGLPMIDQALAGCLAGEGERLETVVWAACTMLGACEVAGDIERAMQWLRVIDEFTDRYACPFVYATCRTHYSALLLAKGRWAQAERELAAAIRMSGRAGPLPHALAMARLADLRLSQGRVEEAEVLLGDCDDVVIAAKVALARGQADSAATLLRGCIGPGMGASACASALLLLVEAELAAGRPDAAEAAQEQLAQLAVSPPPTDVAAANAATAAGHVAAARGDTDEACARYRAALRILARLDLPLEAAKVRLALARSLAGPHPEMAAGEARAALGVFEDAGATPLADAAAALLRSLGSRGRRAPRRPGVLTAREDEVLRLVGLGLSNPEIAQRLFISRKTASHHVSRVLSKLGLRNRAEAVAYVSRLPGRDG
jgi:DNA-binding CsgD family transcriptional regulator